MLFEVEHTTRLDYSQPVALEPIAVRLRPRQDRAQSLRSFELNLDPAPAGRTEVSDLEGNDTDLIWFNQMTTSLQIRTRMRAETHRSNPFDYLVVNAEALRLPMSYPEAGTGALDRYLRPSGDPQAAQLARTIADEAGNDAARFLTDLTAHLAGRIAGEIRMEGDPMAPGETLARNKGSCRDVTVLFMDACRSVGLAARFVSGYQEGDPDIEEKHLHAWPEVYLSRVGWRGFDPTLGIAVADRHLALAAAPTSSGAAPTEGSYRGSALSAIKVDLKIQVGDHP